jgi:hypothetical protein
MRGGRQIWRVPEAGSHDSGPVLVKTRFRHPGFHGDAEDFFVPFLLGAPGSVLARPRRPISSDDNAAAPQPKPTNHPSHPHIPNPSSPTSLRASAPLR